MSKKTIGIIVASIVLVALIIGGFLFIGRDTKNTNGDPTLEDYQKYNPDLTQEDFDNFNVPMDDETLKKAQDLLNEIEIPEIDNYVEDEDPYDNVHTYIGTDGEMYEFIVDENIHNMDPYEAEKEMQKIKDSLANGSFELDIQNPEVDIPENSADTETITGENTEIVDSNTIESEYSADYNIGLDGGDWSKDYVDDSIGGANVITPEQANRSENMENGEHSVGPGTGQGITWQ